MYPGAFAATRPDHPAVIMAGTGQTMTYAELDEEANRLSQLFRSLGLQPGDHVAFCMENHPRFLAVAWGCHYAGLYYTAMSSRLTDDEMQYILNDCGARAFITTAYKREAAEKLLDQAPNVETWLMIDGTVDGYESYEDTIAAQPAEPLRRPDRRRRHALQLGHHRQAEGRQAADAEPAARGCRDLGVRPHGHAVRPHRGQRLPLPRAALPRCAAALLHGRAHERRHGRGDGALRSRGGAGRSSRSTG